MSQENIKIALQKALENSHGISIVFGEKRSRQHHVLVALEKDYLVISTNWHELNPKIIAYSDVIEVLPLNKEFYTSEKFLNRIKNLQELYAAGEGKEIIREEVSDRIKELRHFSLTSQDPQVFIGLLDQLTKLI